MPPKWNIVLCADPTYVVGTVFAPTKEQAVDYYLARYKPDISFQPLKAIPFTEPEDTDVPAA
jgi:hypothetical protein